MYRLLAAIALLFSTEVFALPLQEITRAGIQAPQTPTGVRFDQFYTNSSNVVTADDGTILFGAKLIGSGVSAANEFGVFLVKNGVIQKLARKQEQAPGVPAGVLFSSFDGLQIGPTGTAFFEGVLQGPGIQSGLNHRGA